MYTLLNAAPDTGNQGVSALSAAAVDGLSRRGIDRIAVADHGSGRRIAADGTERFGLTHNRRLWRGDCLRTVSFCAPLGGLASPSARLLATSRAVLDVSGGDSFTDLYGPHRFRAMIMTKRLALRCGRPLFLLPQTIGPFRSEEARREATEILRAAHGIWLRDKRSEEMLKELLGADFDPARHRRGPDMAVLLPRVAPEGLPVEILDWLVADRAAPVAGLNVSGLLWHDAAASKARFGLAASHRDQIEAAARALLDSAPDMRLLLVPHVHRPDGHPESDRAAAEALAMRLGPAYAERVAVLPGELSAQELKWVLARLDWFAGARMHATIGAFSSGVPTLGLGYSDKAEGVFEECGLAGHVADLRKLDVAALAARVSASVATRSETSAALAQVLPGVKARAEAQMDAIAGALKALPA
ncbi:polysaccharide pyruvyl transferase family protein [Aliiruegeria lutimaris]|uniref:Polysaccharide pyruvyl transferase family protein WcaK n=1 Tax=Aliiruegeria lutimaris TaxID=571298 RepID=A0A1G8WL52_9RHOB|nr:polysaccharide pyruvyl transferase family protein [Aliiruegeria lutimaris]SDJ79092.1 Polysaccharide pyruvyl transferase family protein WcaK [Aliiruegeria lutimaris]